MGLKNFKYSWVETTVSYELYFPTSKTGGYSFPCDINGNVNEDELADAAKENLRRCRAGEVETIGNFTVEENIHKYRHPAEGECSCGNIVMLDNTSYEWAWQGNDCACGKIYNLSGDELRPRSEWEERIDDDY